MMKRLLTLALLLAPLCGAAEETLTCGEYARRLDSITKDMNEQRAAGNKVAAAVNEGLINVGGKNLREQCIDPYVCDEFADQLNSGKMPPGYGDSFTGMLAYLQNACGGGNRTPPCSAGLKRPVGARNEEAPCRCAAAAGGSSARRKSVLR
jgi:hypothetical protein